MKKICCSILLVFSTRRLGTEKQENNDNSLIGLSLLFFWLSTLFIYWRNDMSFISEFHLKLFFLYFFVLLLKVSKSLFQKCPTTN